MPNGFKEFSAQNLDVLLLLIISENYLSEVISYIYYVQLYFNG